MSVLGWQEQEGLEFETSLGKKFVTLLSQQKKLGMVAPVIPATLGSKNRKIEFQASLGKK
jgi:hypothetical protein